MIKLECVTLDVQRLNKEYVDDFDILCEILELLLNKWPQYIEQVNSAIMGAKANLVGDGSNLEERELKILKAAIHTFKGTLSQFFPLYLVEELKKCENLLLEQKFHAAVDLWHKLQFDLDLCKNELSALHNSLK